MIRDIFILMVKTVIALLLSVIFFMAYVGFVYLFLDGNIPQMTSLWSTISLLIGGCIGIRLVDI